jgi:AcrR family transcriptional regulator
VTKNSRPASVRRPRADAERNRLLLLKAAKSAFAEKGAAASLEEIAREAGVGIGTLYRHFPTREALIEALYGSEVEQLVGAAALLMQREPPLTALRGWLLIFVDYIVTKHVMADVLKSIVGSSSYATSGKQVKQAITDLVDRAVKNGDIRLDIEPLDLLRALSGVANLSAGPQSKEAAKRLADILIAGIRRP